MLQEDYMRASRGDAREDWDLCRSLWPRGTPYHKTRVRAMIPGDLDRARAALREAGYANQRAVIINPTDFPDIGPLGLVSRPIG